MAVERRKKEDMRRIQEEIHLHQHRGDQQKHVSERVAATPPMKQRVYSWLQTIKEDVQAELQESEDRNKERVRRLEEEMKIIREKLNRLPWALQKQVTKATAISPLAPSAPGEDAKKEQNEQDNHMRPAVVTAQPDHPKRVLVEKEPEQIALSEIPCQAQGELFPAREQEEQLRQQVEGPEQNGQNIKAEPEAELPEAQSAIMAVERRKKEDMRRIQEEIHLHQHRGDQQKHVSERVAATPPMKQRVYSWLQTIKEDVQAELQESEDRNKERVRRLEEEMKIIREKLNRLPWALQKQVTKATAISPLAPSAPGEDAKKEQNKQDNHMRPAVVTAQPDHPKRTIKEDVQAELQESEDRNKARVRRLEEEMKIVREEVNPLLQALQNQVQVSTSHLAACKDFQQTMGNEGPQGRMMNVESPVMKYTELEHIGSGSFGDVVRALNNTTGGEKTPRETLQGKENGQ
ncbi:involucrin-like isoform X2 [Passer domesticus]|uniref:involucrin-like isoform X2 n=2 Tax=Passer domesticus TaxID=48849 RepID=UPI0030FE671B